MVQAPKDEAKSSEELDPDTDDSTRLDKPIRRSAKDKDYVFVFFHQFFFSILCLLLTLSIFLYVFSFTCNTHGLGAVLRGLLSARRRSPRRLCEWHCLFHADSTVATQNSTATERIELGYNSFQCAEEQTLLYSFKSPSLRHILRVSLFPTLISVVNTCTMCK